MSYTPVDRNRSAAMMVTTSPEFVEITPGHFLVPSSSADGAFYVTTSTTCTCPDHSRRQNLCKHSRAVQIRALMTTFEREDAF
jgi:hypothetical protein